MIIPTSLLGLSYCTISIIYFYISPISLILLALPETLAKTLIPFLGAPQTFMHCSPGGEWIENYQSNPTQTLFIEGVFMTDPDEPSASRKPNLGLMFFTWYPNNLFIIESFRKQDFKLQMPKEYASHSHSQCQLFTPTTPTSILTTPLYPTLFSLSSKQKLIQLPSGSALPMMIPPQSMILPHQKTGLAFLWD
ncbi:hypothetical protein O181_008572 [Austropuccinia psidii MF-1]|uniref:Uncharacterized protein n=1 Tax=Austropuccinia psidii MF-1 TaxID=1389203 RepID=A0A9Q3BQ06_9BASI|nr:hypothetical protein [Austropuccinia psidii MF-1]